MFFQLAGALLIALIGVSVHLLSTMDAPPADFGKGSMFDQIAGRYDMINRVLALGMDVNWRQHMVLKIAESLADNPSPRILDIATGTADVALLLAKQLPSASIVGVDPSSNMLDVGRQKTDKQGLSNNIHLQVADARELSSALSSQALFDAATMSFGIRNVPEKSQALCEIHGLLQPGSRFCILEFSEPDDSFGVMGVLARFFIRHVVPVVGGVLSGAPKEYLHLQNSIKEFPSPSEFSKLLEGLDCNGGYFSMEELIQLNFGSVQLYVTRSAMRKAPE
jgi:demethylmenaquinone methyltransferase/2-methoxy-6-polyprenyl-1,4-benzoquinol methylase